MAGYIEIQTRKIISSYGGVGSIIETPRGALLIEDFSKWPFFVAIKEGQLKAEDFVINDDRLLKRLQNVKSFPKLKHFLRVPADYSNLKVKTEPSNRAKSISAKFFPEWFYCHNCDRFNKLDHWWSRWQAVQHKHKNSDYSKIRSTFFTQPKCYHCFDQAKEKSKKKLYYELEQVRFIMTSPLGRVRDISWDEWPSAQKDVKEENSDKGRIVLQGTCCDHQDLRYYKSTKLSDLAGIRIECASCKMKNTLSGIFGLWFPVPNKPIGAKEKVVIRTSNSVYYPMLVNSIYLPTEKGISLEDQQSIKEWMEEGEDVSFIFKALKKKYPTEKIESFIAGEIENNYEPEVEYRLKEYLFLTEPTRIVYPAEDSKDTNLIFSRQANQLTQSLGIDHLTAIKRLKITTVQTAYTRQEPLDKDQFLGGEDLQGLKIDAKYTSGWGKDTEYLPAVESFGEGIFFTLNEGSITEWIQENKAHDAFNIRLETLWNNYQANDFVSKQKFSDQDHMARFVLLHTLSHLLMKELEFLCGYPATSLSERLFIDSEVMQGILIYTVAGSEGSYGGLVSQATDKSFNRLLRSALFRATDCASDPICYHSEDGQGVGGLNQAACFSCTLVPENACEEFNSFLDRALLIDQNFGYFKAAFSGIFGAAGSHQSEHVQV